MFSIKQNLFSLYNFYIIWPLLLLDKVFMISPRPTYRVIASVPKCIYDRCQVYLKNKQWY